MVYMNCQVSNWEEHKHFLRHYIQLCKHKYNQSNKYFVELSNCLVSYKEDSHRVKNQLLVVQLQVGRKWKEHSE